MTILGDKIDSVNIEKNKYNIDYNQIEIKSKFDLIYGDKASITKDEIIYIKQGDIVRYFEDKKLEDLAKEANKGTLYTETRTLFTEHKRKFDTVIDSYLEAYSVSADVKGQKFMLHDSTIENLLSEHFVFSWNKKQSFEKLDQTALITESKDLLDLIKEKNNELKIKAVLSFTVNELQIIKSYEDLIDVKLVLISQLEKLNIKKLKFLNSIDSVIDSVNQQLTQEARSKSESKKIINDLKIGIEKKFNSSVILKKSSDSLEKFNYELKQPIEINDSVSLILEIEKGNSIIDLILEGIQNGENNISLYLNTLGILNSKKSIKNYSDASSDSLRKKIRKQLSDLLNSYDNPTDYLEYENGESSKKNSPGYNSEKYLEIILKNPKSKIIFIDQPEDNLGNKFITDTLVKLIREIKFNKQIFLVTHNPSIVVYGDAESIIIASNESNKISYKQVVLENQNAQKEICGILDGGEYIFNMRSKKYNIKRILKEN
jgi:hypothetical protein